MAKDASSLLHHAVIIITHTDRVLYSYYGRFHSCLSVCPEGAGHYKSFHPTKFSYCYLLITFDCYIMRWDMMVIHFYSWLTLYRLNKPFVDIPWCTLNWGQYTGISTPCNAAFRLLPLLAAMMVTFVQTAEAPLAAEGWPSSKQCLAS